MGARGAVGCGSMCPVWVQGTGLCEDCRGSSGHWAALQEEFSPPVQVIWGKVNPINSVVAIFLRCLANFVMHL